jgi:hypothetical protein
MRKKRNAHRVLVEISEGKRQFRRLKSTTDLQKIERKCMDWIHPARDKYNGGLL